MEDLSVKKLLRNRYLWLSVAILVVVAGVAIGYRTYSNRKFNAVISSLQRQELRGTDNYVTVANLNYEIVTAGTSNSASNSQLSLLQKDANNMKQVVASSCSNQASDITSTNLDSRVKRLWLSGSQKKYIADAKTVLNDLASSMYADGGMCRAGELLLGSDENYIQILPGIVTMAQLQNNPDTPSAQQVNSLQKYTTASVADYTELQRSEPDVAAFYKDVYTLYTNIYYALKAAEAGNTSEAAQYAAKVNQLETSYNTASSKSNAAATAFDTKLYTSAIVAAKAEISLIDAQGHNNELAAKLDYSVPVFWMLDAKLGLYSEASKKDTSPHASSVQQLVSILHDSDLATLYDRNLLQKASYSSLGSNNSGSELAVTLANGNTLTEKDPPIQ